MASAYAVIGRLSLLLAIPPGYATAIWPPAGLALAGVLTMGRRVWPGIFLGSFLVMYFSAGGRFRTAIDDWVGTFLIFILAAVQIICFSWVHGIDRGWKELHEGAHVRIPRVYKFVMKWVAPLYLLTVFFFFCKNNLGGWIRNAANDPLQQGGLALVGGTLLLLIVCLRIGEKRWRAQGLDIDDRKPITD